jgi:hypothetical protein
MTFPSALLLSVITFPNPTASFDQIKKSPRFSSKKPTIRFPEISQALPASLATWDQLIHVLSLKPEQNVPLPRACCSACAFKVETDLVMD